MSHRAGLTRTRNMYYGFESRYELTKTIMLKIEGADVMHLGATVETCPKQTLTRIEILMIDLGLIFFSRKP